MKESGISADTWHNILISIVNYEYRFFVDGRLSKAIKLDPALPERGEMTFENHAEFWIDDL